MSLRARAGALLYDVPRYLRSPWVRMHNRRERVTYDERGVRCEWQYTTDLHIAKVFPSTGVRLMRRAFADWPIEMRDARSDEQPDVTFVVGHRGLTRLPHLLQTLRSIAGQRDAAVECIVVEQSREREIEASLPAWVRYVHTPVPSPDYEYNRAWTLNVGARLARGELLVLHDNDMLCPAAYASEALARKREGWDFLEIKRFTFYLPEEATREVFATRVVRTDVPSTIVQNLHGASICVAKDAYAEIGGFDESFVGWGGEDNEFWERAESRGGLYTFGYLPFLHLFHAPQRGKIAGEAAPAVRRFFELTKIPPAERMQRLKAREWGSLDAPHGD
jgi:N-terminal domain of galactosyltransferase